MSSFFIIVIFVIRSIFEFFFLPQYLEVHPSRARRGQEKGKEWKQNKRGLPREWSTIHSRMGLR